MLNYLCRPMSKPQAALVEFYDSHEVNLYSQLCFLRDGGYEVTLIVSEKHRDTVAAFGGGFEVEFVRVTALRGRAQWKELWRIRGLLLRRGISTVVFNTAHSNPVRNFCLFPFPTTLRFFGTLHGVNKLQGSFTQKLISRRIPNYFLLSDYMLEKAMKMPRKGLRFEVFYPIFHPPYGAVTLPPKPDGQLWIAIPGSVEYKRRDYVALVDAFGGLPSKPDVRFLLLGNARHRDSNGPELKKRVETAGIADHFLFFDSYVPNATLHAFMGVCDAVMPLIHPVNADMEKYLENQISGAFHLAFAYRKPLLMHDYFCRYQDFQETALFYALPEFPAFLESMQERISSFHSDLRYANPKWRMAYQSERYNRFLKGGK